MPARWVYYTIESLGMCNRACETWGREEALLGGGRRLQAKLQAMWSQEEERGQQVEGGEVEYLAPGGGGEAAA